MAWLVLNYLFRSTFTKLGITSKAVETFFCLFVALDLESWVWPLFSLLYVLNMQSVPQKSIDCSREHLRTDIYKEFVILVDT